MPSLPLAIRMIHGDKDRATSHLATMAFYERINSPEKEIQIYEGYEHVMTKVSLSFLSTTPGDRN